MNKKPADAVAVQEASPCPAPHVNQSAGVTLLRTKAMASQVAPPLPSGSGISSL